MHKYPDLLLIPMRQELTRLGFRELRTATDVDSAIEVNSGTMMMVVNSVCGCAARNARPAVAIALDHTVRPDALTTVFAGQDHEATARAREFFAGYPPSSPSIAILRGGELVYMMERHQIEGRSAVQIASDLTVAFDRFCKPAAE